MRERKRKRVKESGSVGLLENEERRKLFKKWEREREREWKRVVVLVY